jgi:hypothetical protein
MSTARSKGGTPIERPRDYHPYRIQMSLLGNGFPFARLQCKGKA